MSASTSPTPSSVLSQRLAAFRHHMAQAQLTHYWLSASDTHLNEYLAPPHKRRDWLCGFTGSAGDLLVGLHQAWLFADSRYHEQAEQEVPPEVTVVKVGLPQQLCLRQTLVQQAQVATTPLRLGYASQTLSAQSVAALRKALNKNRGTLPMEEHPQAHSLVDACRQQLEGQVPPIPLLADSVVPLPLSLCGHSTAEKLATLRQHMAEHGYSVLPLVKLDEIAWLFNLRGQDIDYNPVFWAYALLTPQQVVLCCHAQALSPAAQQALLEIEGLQQQPYEAFWEQLLLHAAGHTVGVAEKSLTQAVVHTLQGLEAQGTVLHPLATSPVEALKAVKTPQELTAMRCANQHASQGLIKTLAWLAHQAQQGTATTTEADLATTLEANYRAQGASMLSFNTIAGSGPASSVVHYGTPNATQPIPQGAWVLLDSGMQREGGTTDTTRTVLFGGTPTPKQRWAYTHVLKAHIACASTPFPSGTTGAVLDGAARAPLWRAGMDYGHGTGHGVGAYLNVHEGPIGISKGYTTPFVEGHITSIEPGYYEPGWGGIRLENLYEVVLTTSANRLQIAEGSPKTPWLCFESLTWVPFERDLIEINLLDAHEVEWLQAYYHGIAERMRTPQLPWSLSEAAWLDWQLGLFSAT